MKSIIIVLVLLVFLSGLYVYASGCLDTREGLQSIDEKTAKCPNILVQNGDYLELYNSTDTHFEMPVMFNNLDEYANYLRKQRENGIHCPVMYLQKETDNDGKFVFRMKSTPFNDINNEPFLNKQNKSSNDSLPKFPTNLKNDYAYYNIEGFGDAISSGSPAPSGITPAPALPQQPSSNTPPSQFSPVIESKNYPFNKDQYPGFDPYGFKVGKYTDLDKIHDSTKTSAQLSDNPMDPNWGGTQYTKEAVDSGKYIENNVYPVNYSMPGGVQFYPGLYKTYPDPPNFVTKIGEPSGVRGGRTI